MNLNFSPFPDLQTPRLRLRPMRLEDAPEVLILRSDPEVLRYIPIKPAKHLQDARKYIEMINTGISDGEWILWGICLKEADQLIGTICFWNISKENATGEIGYVLLPSHHRKGLMTEAVKEALAFGFKEIGFQNIEAVLTPENTNSVGLLKKYKFSLDRDFKEEEEVCYVLSAKENKK